MELLEAKRLFKAELHRILSVQLARNNAAQSTPKPIAHIPPSHSPPAIARSVPSSTPSFRKRKIVDFKLDLVHLPPLHPSSSPPSSSAFEGNPSTPKRSKFVPPFKTPQADPSQTPSSSRSAVPSMRATPSNSTIFNHFCRVPSRNPPV